MGRRWLEAHADGPQAACRSAQRADVCVQGSTLHRRAACGCHWQPLASETPQRPPCANARLVPTGVRHVVLERGEALTRHPQAHFINNRTMEVGTPGPPSFPLPRAGTPGVRQGIGARDAWPRACTATLVLMVASSPVPWLTWPAARLAAGPSPARARHCAPVILHLGPSWLGAATATATLPYVPRRSCGRWAALRMRCGG